MRGVAVVCLGVLLGGCVSGLAQRRAMLDQFVGHPEQELLQRLGVPDRTYETGGTKYLAYEDSKVALLPPAPPFGPGPWWLNGWSGGMPPEAVELRCETTFAVIDGVVKSYALHGNACG